MKLYNHAFSIAFSIDTNNEGDKVTAEELLDGLRKRLHDLEKNPPEIIEACGMPYDTYENDVPNSQKYILKED